MLKPVHYKYHQQYIPKNYTMQDSNKQPYRLVRQFHKHLYTKITDTKTMYRSHIQYWVKTPLQLIRDARKSHLWWKTEKDMRL